MEGIYFDDSQYDICIQFDNSRNLFVHDSVVVDDEEMVGDDERAKSDEIVKDTYEKEEKESFIEDVDGQEESSRLNLKEDESVGGQAVLENRLLSRVIDVSNNVNEVRNVKPPFDFDLNEIPLPENTPPLSPRVKDHPSFNLNKIPPGGADEENPEMAKSEVYDERDFDLNKLATAGQWHFTDGFDEREFILMLRILLPDYH